MTDLFSLLSSAFLCIVRFNSNELSIYCLYFENKTYKIAKKKKRYFISGIIFSFSQKILPNAVLATSNFIPRFNSVGIPS